MVSSWINSRTLAGIGEIRRGEELEESTELTVGWTRNLLKTSNEMESPGFLLWCALIKLDTGNRRGAHFHGCAQLELLCKSPNEEPSWPVDWRRPRVVHGSGLARYRSANGAQSQCKNLYRKSSLAATHTLTRKRRADDADRPQEVVSFSRRRCRSVRDWCKLDP